MNNKSVIITGATGDVGKKLVVEYAKQGYNVCVAFNKSEDKAYELAEKCKEFDVDIICRKCDLADSTNIGNLVDDHISKFNRLDVLINNAAITKFSRPLEFAKTISDEDFMNVYKINVVAAYTMICECMEHLSAAKGSIINISSTAGVNGIGSSVAYAASKGALNTITLFFAKQLAPTIRVNAICPGVLKSKWWDRYYKGNDKAKNRFYQRQEQANVLNLLCNEQDIADLALFLTECRSITGEILRLDAGNHLGKSIKRTKQT